MGLVRIFLALAVVVDHWRVWILAPRDAPHASETFKLGFNAGYAVMFFFVISGFLITYTLTKNYGRDVAGTLQFYGNRFIRIFSLYWPLVVVALIIVPGAWEKFAASSVMDQLVAVLLIAMDWSMSFARDPTIKGLEPAWTLAPELWFYLLAPLLMRWWKFALAALVVFLGVRLSFVAALGAGFNGLWTYVFPPSSYCFFLLGHVACRASERWAILASPILGIGALVASLAVMTLAPPGGFDGPRFWISILLFTISLPGLFQATKGISWMNRLGDLSYPIYLVHGIVLSVAGAALAGALPLQSPYASVLVVLALVVLAAAVSHWLMEKPAAHAMRRAARLRRYLPAAASAEG